ncbi:hypothetical protein MVEN_00467300 [Mycena venus]|uniref:CxC2-like cysteine cluster KDZ transposase-associated domain-containing protein n=1 Tax=Mycena venus TaxID=2733690 RepID=A0A8H7DBU4_9AGAR|nr:hypothetical protein MVEN_00467300 [Mycena venus]
MGAEPEPDILRPSREGVITFDPSSVESKRKQGQSQYITQVQQHLPRLQNLILATFAHDQLGQPCGCGGEASFRCVDCFNAPMWCIRCAIGAHIYNPFHRIEEWDGKMFVRSPMWKKDDVSSSICLSTHPSGIRCPHSPPAAKGPPRHMLIVDHNGFHKRYIEFCHCRAPIPWEQLVLRRLFPASFKEPKTAFTFTVLKQFHVHSLASKKSAYDYVKGLCQLTNNGDPDSVDDRYEEFVRACRIWRFLVIQRRAGQAPPHGIDKHIPHRRPNCLALRCPACPEIGFNVSEEEVKSAAESERHKYTLFVSTDGDFKLQRKKKKEDPDDFALNDGNAHFVPTPEYKVYMEDIAKDDPKPDDDGNCPHLKAGRMHNIVKFKNSVVSGVIAVQCARHGFYLPQGIVDLPRGEGYKYADFAVCYALCEAAGLPWIFLTYDIWCKYGVYLKDRILKRFPSMAPIINRVMGAIGKVHNPGHGTECQDEYNLNYTPNVGLVSGELIETGWAELNLSAGSTREMNEGHRHDVLDAVCDHWNWEKLVKLPHTLLRKYRDARSQLRARTATWELVDSKQRSERPEAVKEWEKAGVTPQPDPRNKNKLLRVFHPNFQTGPPTTRAAYDKMRAREQGPGNEGRDTLEDLHSRDVRLMKDGLSIVEDRRDIHRLLASSRTAQHKIRTERKQLYTKLVAFRGTLLKRAPTLYPHMTEIDFDEPEETQVLLPSDFSAAERTSLKLDSLGQIEFDLRREAAYQALHDLKDHIQLRNFVFGEKKSHANGVHGVAANTRAGQYLGMLKNNIEMAGDRYRRIRKALIALGLPADDTSFQPLPRNEQRGKDALKLKPGDSRRPDPWFWHAQRPAGLDEEGERAWETELERVRWYRARELKNRAHEEVEILEAEFKRATTWFLTTANIWTTMGDIENSDNVKGSREYAHKQAAIYRRLGNTCEAHWNESSELVRKDEIEEETGGKTESC